MAKILFTHTPETLRVKAEALAEMISPEDYYERLKSTGASMETRLHMLVEYKEERTAAERRAAEAAEEAARVPLGGSDGAEFFLRPSGEHPSGFELTIRTLYPRFELKRDAGRELKVFEQQGRHREITAAARRLMKGSK